MEDILNNKKVLLLPGSKSSILSAELYANTNLTNVFHPMVIDVTKNAEARRRRYYELCKRIQYQNPGYNYHAEDKRNTLNY